MRLTYNVLLVFAILWRADSSAPVKNKSLKPLARFPDDFFFGAATSAYQIEGGWTEGAKGWSICDYFMQVRPNATTKNSTGNIACDSYHLYKRDVEMISDLDLDVYRFSIAWSRILPFGTADYINPLGVEYYSNLINELIAKGVTPFVTMFHWDLPLRLHEKGGFMVDDIVDWFSDYARVLFQEFGDRVKNWITLNEPDIFCMYAYGYAQLPPYVYSPGKGYYECVRNVLLANARAYHIYQKEFKTSQKGEVGIAINFDWAMIEDKKNENALLDYQAFHIGRYLDPICSEQGDYPKRFIDIVESRSLAQGSNSSRLRLFTPSEVEYMKGTADFIGLNHYITKYLYRNASVSGLYEVPSFDDDLHVGYYQDPSWLMEHAPMMVDYAPGFYQLLMYLKETYPKMKIYVTESGAATSDGLNDEKRVKHLRNYMNALLQALADGVNVQGYITWSLMDNFQWIWGYDSRFGLYEVDFNDPNRTRTPRKSALVFKNIIKTRKVDETYNPDPFSFGAAAANTLNIYAFLVTVIFLLIK